MAIHVSGDLYQIGESVGGAVLKIVASAPRFSTALQHRACVSGIGFSVGGLETMAFRIQRQGFRNHGAEA